jgi:DNA-binding FrmR family transcriptional regulator
MEDATGKRADSGTTGHHQMHEHHGTNCSHDTGKTVVQPHKDPLIKRMNRITGQVNGVTKMIQDDRYCVDILTQINAIKSALDGVAMILLEDHIKHCVRNAVKSGGGDDVIEELTDIIRKFTK